MTQWYVKDLSKLTEVSVQTLHHYDRIDLLKPSVRLPNGYRVYSENDLSKLQQIIALKFFGFELSKIKILLAEESNVVDHFASQSQFLEEKGKMLLEASKALKMIIADCDHDKSIPWQTVIKLIEVYHMTQQLQKTWEAKAFNQKEFNEYVDFEKNVRSKYSEKELEAIKNRWLTVIAEVEANLAKDPTSDDGIELGKRAMDWVNSFYGENHVRLRNAVWEKGFKGGHIENHALSAKGVAWLDKAIDAYYRARLAIIFDQVDKISDKELAKQWNDLLINMYGNEQSLKDAFYNEVMQDVEISVAVKNWLKRI